MTTSYRWHRGEPARVLHGPSGTTDMGMIAIRNGWIGGWENDVFPVNTFARDLHTRAVNRTTGFGVPYSSNARGDLGLFSTIVHRDGRIVNLPVSAPNPPRLPRVLSDHGLAAGFANDGEQVHAVVWHGC